MQGQKMGELEDELRETREQLGFAEDQRNRALEELQEIKHELKTIKDSLSVTQQQLELKDVNIESLKSELQRAKDDNIQCYEHKQNDHELEILKHRLSVSQESEEAALLKVTSLIEELNSLKNEVKLATDAEEKSRKAMDDLALALKEVATESAEARGKLSGTQLELDQVKQEAQKLKEMVRGSEERYEKLLEDARKETEMHRNTVERLRLEAEESIFAWNGKEMGFVTCIKRAEEERAVAQHEANKLAEALRAAREESYKLRDILKQAINEANVAKSAADIARAENSQLKDLLSEKDESLHFLSRENERLRINEAAANENVKQFKLMLSYVSRELKAEEKEDSPEEEDDEDDDDEDHLQMTNGLDPRDEEEDEDYHPVVRKFSFGLSELSLLKDEDEDAHSRIEHEDPEKLEALKGSIFDTPFSPKSEPRTPQRHMTHHRRKSTAFTDAEGSPSAEDAENNSADIHHHIDESDNERISHRRKRALFRRVGDLLLRKSFSRKEPSPVPSPSPVSVPPQSPIHE
ncbi:unnamed protein product [Cuscuta europaea]|uniref:Uncharacterized protein n=1 Tax=Cuscuta europaea TaxID=41803 RepID=A0A9P0Z5A8_CUSEU|nr:unnamed protein product [Cuscuta europaea]